MSGIHYERLPTSPEAPPDDIRAAHEQLAADPRFSPPPPPMWQRAALIVFVCFLYWLAYHFPRAAVGSLE